MGSFHAGTPARSTDAGAELIAFGARAGVPVFCEKPIGT